MRFIFYTIGSIALWIVLPGLVLAAGDAARGESLYQGRCIACHSLDANRVGPKHRGVFGRKAGSVEGYVYSPALEAAQIVWDEAALDRWLSDPDSLIPGQRMGYRTGSVVDRQDLIAFLRRESN